jgi:hypothetical protein
MASQQPASLFDYYFKGLDQGKIPNPSEQWVQLLRTLPNRPLADPVLASELKLTLELDASICTSCSTLIGDCLTRNFPTERWQELGDGYSTIMVLADDGTRLFTRSRTPDCLVHALIHEQLAATPNGDDSIILEYHVFVQPQESHNYQFFVCFGDVVMFAGHPSQWPRDHAKQLKLFKTYPSEDQPSSVPDFHTTHLHLHNGQQLSLPRLHNNNPRSSQALSVADQWYQNCLKQHPHCKRDNWFFPKRVIDIREVDSRHTVYLYLAEPNDRHDYATISYTWGASGYKRLKTKNDDPNHPELTERSHQQGIAVDKFPETLQDAIWIAKRLKFEYLWIDSVCIVQDDEADWAEQSAEMTNIYAGAKLNISASSCENSEQGFLQKTRQHGNQIGRVLVERMDTSGTVLEQDLLNLHIGTPVNVLDLDDKTLASRGWVFQERLVSIATLHYTDEGIMWECVDGTRMESDQDNHPVDWKQHWKAVMDVPHPVVVAEEQTQASAIDAKENVLNSWKYWMEAYSERQLFDFEDRLPAIAGVAKTLSERFGLNYAAGLWQEDVLGGLMWKRFKNTMTLIRHVGDAVPTWSWASVQGRLEYLDVKLRSFWKGPMLEIIGKIEVELPPKALPGSFGKVRSAKITVKGLLQRVVVDLCVHPSQRKKAWEEVGVKEGFVNPTNVLVTLDQPFNFDGELLPCWCLRLGSYAAGGRESDVFLLLEDVSGGQETFRRIGLIEVDGWFDRLSVTADSGRLGKREDSGRLLETAELRTLVLV